MSHKKVRTGPIITPPRADLIPLVQFYSIQLSPLAGGGVSLGIMATLCEDEGELVGMEIASARVASVADAASLIERAVAFAPFPAQ